MTVLIKLVVNKSINAKENLADTQFRNILRVFDVLPNFLLPQVKRWTIITYKHGITTCLTSSQTT